MFEPVHGGMMRRDRAGGVRRLGTRACGIAVAALLGFAATALGPTALGPTAQANEGDRSAALLREATETGAYLAGRLAENMSDFRTAAALLDRVLEDNPADVGIRRRALLANFQAGNYDRAAELAETTVAEEESPPSLAFIVLAGRALIVEDWASALAHLDRMDRSGLARYAQPIARAWALAGVNETDAAIEALSVLSDQQGFSRLRRLHEALIFAHGGRFAEAEASLTEADEDILDLPFRIVRAMARIYSLQGREDGARELLDRYVERHGDSPALTAQIEQFSAERPSGEENVIRPASAVSDGFYHLASGLRSSVQRSTDSVVLVYAHLSAMLDEEFDLPLLLIGELLEDRERHEEAIDVLRRVDSSSIYYWDARLRIADNLVDLNRDKAATDLLEAMAAERPESTEPLVKLGYLLRSRQRYLDEVDVYDRAISRIGEPQREHWLLFYNRGIAYERSKQWPPAEKDFLKALELKPDDPFVLNYLGYSWVEQGVNIPEAKEMIRKAVEQRQNDGYIVDSLGWVLYRIGEYEEAVRHLERAVQLRPQDPVINDHLGDAYWRVGRRNEARFQWDRALSLEPDEDLAPKIEAKLRDGLGEHEIIDISE